MGILERTTRRLTQGCVRHYDMQNKRKAQRMWACVLEWIPAVGLRLLISEICSNPMGF